MYHILFDSSLEMPVGEIRQIAALIQASCPGLAVIPEHARNLPAAFYRKGKAQARRTQGLDFLKMAEQSQRADII